METSNLLQTDLAITIQRVLDAARGSEVEARACASELSAVGWRITDAVAEAFNQLVAEQDVAA